MRDHASGPRHRTLGPRRSRFWIVPVVGVGCILSIIMARMLEEPIPGTPLQEVPSELVGRWVTSAPRYAGRALLIAADELALDVGPEEPMQRGTILVVTTRVEDDVPVIYIEYDVGEGPMVMEIILEGPDRMHLRNPPDVTWTRAR